MTTTKNLLCLSIILVVGVAGAKAEQKRPITETCLVCMCEALSGCNATAVCVNGACGIFRLTWDQWVDSGRLTVGGEPPQSENSFTNCANDPYCSADTLQNYMVKYGQDCNGDEQVDCYDYGAIHYMGPFNCQADMPYNYESIFKNCLKRAKKQQQQQQQ
ncbi:hypothetical protein AWZ03_004408 [Drosophila navojoa]|uniref:lysozyme n=1 Tax=Drosophila navojoa TaxID=7232 RepID=A0A484BK38_DRONA|nr:lysozyme-like [Drosophila navojoa]TDG49108.1 hypothetical protein AWZ03_004408 [Drosophila navojoa]